MNTECLEHEEDRAKVYDRVCPICHKALHQTNYDISADGEIMTEQLELLCTYCDTYFNCTKEYKLLQHEVTKRYHIVREIYRYTGGGVVRIVRTSPTRIWAMDTPCHAKGENIATYTDVRGWKIWE